MPAARAPAAGVVVLISGNGSNLQSLIEHSERGRLNARLLSVISDNADAYGLRRARKHGIPALALPPRPGEGRHEYGRRLGGVIDHWTCDFIALAGFMRILSDDFTSRYLGRLLNIHPSLLPKHKGLNTHQRALDSGDTQHGASVHFVTPRLDSGPVIMQSKIEVRPDDDAASLAKRVLATEHRLYPAALNLCLQARVKLVSGKVMLDNRVLRRPRLLKPCMLDTCT